MRKKETPAKLGLWPGSGGTVEARGLTGQHSKTISKTKGTEMGFGDGSVGKIRT